MRWYQQDQPPRGKLVNFPLATYTRLQAKMLSFVHYMFDIHLRATRVVVPTANETSHINKQKRILIYKNRKINEAISRMVDGLTLRASKPP
jgi:hypothetical protein